MRRYGRRGWKGQGAGPPWAQGRWVHRDLCLWHGGVCEGVRSERTDATDAAYAVKDPWIWVPHACVLRPYDLAEAHTCLSQAWWAGSKGANNKSQPPRARATDRTGGSVPVGWWKEGLDGEWARAAGEGGGVGAGASDSERRGGREEGGSAPAARAALFFSGTSLVRTMYYDIVCLLDAACNATKEHEEMAFASGGARVVFHWLARFADHEPFVNPPLGAVDDRTGRLAFNRTLVDLVAAIREEAPGADSVVVVGTQIFDILKAPLDDYAANLGLLLHALEQVEATVIWRMGDALHDATLDAGWDFSQRPGRYMNDPRMQAANRIAADLMRRGGVGILDVHALTHGREDRSHDGTHYWNMKVFEETGGSVRKGNGVSFTASQMLLNWLCNA